MIRTIALLEEIGIRFLRVEKFSERQMKEVDAKHLLFLWSEGTARQCWLEFKGRLLLWHWSRWFDLNGGNDAIFLL